MNITIGEKIKFASKYSGVNISSLAIALKMSPQNLYKKIQHDRITDNEAYQIGKLSGGMYIAYYAFPNGSFIGDTQREFKENNRAKK